MLRRAIAPLVVLLLAVLIVMFWPDSDPKPPVSDPTTTTTTTAPPATTTSTSVVTTTSTTQAGSHVVENVEEAEEVLRELWFGWFEGIYNQDEDRIREVVASKSKLDAALNAFGASFPDPPTLQGIKLELEILRSDEKCLVTFGSVDVSSFRGDGAVSSSVQVLRWTENGWKFATAWKFKEDLWEEDCESQLQQLP